VPSAARCDAPDDRRVLLQQQANPQRKFASATVVFA